jgi:hypothetical protein
VSPRTFCKAGGINQAKAAETIPSPKERDHQVEVNVRDDSQIVAIWLTNEEKQNAALREQLKPLCKAYRAKKYLVAVFESGGRDLSDMTSALVCYNRKRIARMKAEREKQHGMAMGI